MIAWTEIVASERRLKILQDAGIKFRINENLQLGFKSYNDLMTAAHLLESYLEWCSNERLLKKGP